ncbi:hypothetical protein CDD83_22 [Cordyceps sp. RAO-2017]|nr:hypothetical protein CDD83_22 [Cordyceps sp. RAO-2017]
MEQPAAPVASLAPLGGNLSVAESDDEHLMRCFARQECGHCLAQDGCSWCPFTWACVPNSYAMPLLAPAYDAHICPHPVEQWEIRTRPFGCRVSSITSLSTIVAVLATGLVVLWMLLNLVAIRRWRHYTMQKHLWRDEGGHRRRQRLVRGPGSERDPLLAAPVQS